MCAIRNASNAADAKLPALRRRASGRRASASPSHDATIRAVTRFMTVKIGVWKERKRGGGEEAEDVGLTKYFRNPGMVMAML